MLHELCGARSDFRVETGESLRRAGKGATDATSSVRPLDRAESMNEPARPTCATVWELTAYTNGYVFLTGRFSGELH